MNYEFSFDDNRTVLNDLSIEAAYSDGVESGKYDENDGTRSRDEDNEEMYEKNCK